MATHSNILAWKILGQPGGLWPMGLQRVRHDLVTKQQQHKVIELIYLFKQNGQSLALIRQVDRHRHILIRRWH